MPSGDTEEEIDFFPGGPDDIERSPRETDGSSRLPIDTFPDGADRVAQDTSRHVWLLGTFLGLVVLCTIGWLLWRRLLGRVTEPRVAYARMGHLAALSRLGPSETSTPYEYGRRLGAALPDRSAFIDRIVETYVRACYGWRDLSNEDTSEIAEAWPRVRNGLLRRALGSLLPRRFR